MNGSEEYQHGFTAAQIKTLFADIAEIKEELKDIKKENKSFGEFKVQVMAVASVVSLAVSVISSWLSHFFRGNN